MNIKTVEESLKDYKRKKAIIETTLERIKIYEEAINNPELHDGLFLKQSIEPGMPRASNYRSTSPVEENIISEEKAVELLKIWIKEDHSRIYPYQIEKEQIDMAMGALNEQEKYILECKFFNNMFWRDIEIGFNDRFRQNNFITSSGLKKMNIEALGKLGNILKPYYKKFKIKK